MYVFSFRGIVPPVYEMPRVDVGWWKGGFLRVGSPWLRWILVGDVDDWFPDVGGVRVAVISWRYGCAGGGCVVVSCDPELRMET